MRRGMIIGRFYWGSKDPKDNYQYPSPWFSFNSRKEYETWAKEIRKYRRKNNHGKRTKFEWYYVDLTWTADSMLNHLKSIGHV